MKDQKAGRYRYIANVRKPTIKCSSQDQFHRLFCINKHINKQRKIKASVWSKCDVIMQMSSSQSLNEWSVHRGRLSWIMSSASSSLLSIPQNLTPIVTNGEVSKKALISRIERPSCIGTTSVMIYFYYDTESGGRRMLSPLRQPCSPRVSYN